MFSSWFFGKRTLGSYSGRRGQVRRAKGRIRPQLEVLETRLAPATLTVNSTVDESDGFSGSDPAGPDGLLSLREAISLAPAGDKIVFDPTIFASATTLQLGPTPTPERFEQGDLTIFQGPTDANGINLVTITGGMQFDGGPIQSHRT